MQDFQYCLPIPSSTDKLIPCTYPNCKKFFRSQFSCKRHQLVHTRVKKFACNQCEATFSFAQHLREHNYRHLNIKPYTCGVEGCKETFRHSSELSLHRRIHPEYRLRKYHYIETFEDTKKLRKKYKRKSKPSLEVESDANLELRQSTAIKEKELVFLEGRCAVDSSDVDISFIHFLQNITSQNEVMQRPKLPGPNIDWTTETNTYNDPKTKVPLYSN